MTASLAYSLWVGICWWLRGGKFGALVRAAGLPEPGTTVTRLACAGLATVPLAAVLGWPTIAVWASAYGAMTIGYLGASMGQERQPRDVLLMCCWGVLVCAVMLAGVALALLDLQPVTWAPLGAIAGPAYALNKPLGRRWGLDWTERAELCTGAAFGAAIAAALAI